MLDGAEVRREPKGGQCEVFAFRMAEVLRFHDDHRRTGGKRVQTQQLIAWEENRAQVAFRVSFERREGGMLVSDHMPERDEAAIGTLDEAWTCAERIDRSAPDTIVNIYVVDGLWRPAPGYRSRMLRKHPPDKTADDG